VIAACHARRHREDRRMVGPARRDQLVGRSPSPRACAHSCSAVLGSRGGSSISSIKGCKTGGQSPMPPGAAIEVDRRDQGLATSARIAGFRRSLRRLRRATVQDDARDRSSRRPVRAPHGARDGYTGGSGIPRTRWQTAAIGGRQRRGREPGRREIRGIIAALGRMRGTSALGCVRASSRSSDRANS